MKHFKYLFLLAFSVPVYGQLDVLDEDVIPNISNAKLTDMTGNTIKLRNNSAAGDPEDKKINELTDEPTPASGDLLLAEDGATGELRKVDVTNLPYSVAEATTVSDTAEIDLTETGDDISGVLVAGSIDETKLDASTNASLDLADTSTQPADNISTLTNDSGFISGITHAATTGQTASDHHAKAVSGDIDHDATVNFAAGEHFTQAAISITESQVSDLNHTMEGTAVLSTGETVGKKYLREDGDGTSSWRRITQITNDFEPESTITGSGTGFNLQFGAGDALYLNGSAGTSGQFIKTNGAGSAPTFATVTSESTTVSDTATIDLTLTGVDVSGIVVANSITTAELSDAADVPLVGEFVQVATGGLNVQYRTDAEVRADLDLEIGTDIDAAGTDNSTDVTLAGTGTYVTAVGQVLTVDPIDISTDTNLTGDAEIVLTGDALSIASTIARDTELHGNGTNCSAGNYPLGVDASGNAESCTSAAGGGDVLKVGTPVNDQIGIWTGDGTLEGVPGLRYGSDALSVGAGTSYSGKIGVYSDAALWLIHAQMSTDSTQSATIGAIKSRGTTSAPTAVLSGDDLGQFASRGYDGTSWITGSQMLSSTTEAWSVGNNGTKTVFKTTPNGSATRTTALTLDQDQSATFENDVSIPNGDLSVNGDTVLLAGTASEFSFDTSIGQATQRMFNSTTTPPANTSIGRINFKGLNDTAGEVPYADIRGLVVDDTTAANSGKIIIREMVAGANTVLLESDGASNVSIPNGDLSVTGDIVMPEKADHSGTPAAGNGYLWTKNTAPSTLIFTDDAGTDTTLGSGDVTKVGTPVDNQIGVWTGDGTIEGDAGLTFDGTNKILTVENSGTTGKVTLESQFANGAIKIGNFTATPAADTKVGQILFQGYDDASVLNNYARIQAHVTDDTAGAETGYLSFLPSIGGSNTEALRIDGAGDVSIPNGNLGIGTSSPTSLLDVQSSAAAATKLTVENSGAQHAIIDLTNSAADWRFRNDKTTGNLQFINNGTGIAAIDIDETQIVSISNDLVLTEQSDHTSTPAAGKGYLWTKNTAPSTLIFTDDAGTDHSLISGKYMYQITAEENGALATAAYEWAYGNGNDAAATGGVIVHEPSGEACSVVALSTNTDSGTSTYVVELVLNGTPQGASANVTVTAAEQAINSGFTAIALADGDLVNFRTQTLTSGGTSGNVATMFIECTY